MKADERKSLVAYLVRVLVLLATYIVVRFLVDTTRSLSPTDESPSALLAVAPWVAAITVTTLVARSKTASASVTFFLALAIGVLGVRSSFVFIPEGFVLMAVLIFSTVGGANWLHAKRRREWATAYPILVALAMTVVLVGAFLYAAMVAGRLAAN